MSALLWCTGIGFRVMMTSQWDANGIMALQEWEIPSYCHSEASKQHRKILPCAIQVFLVFPCKPHVHPCDSQEFPVTA